MIRLKLGGALVGDIREETWAEGQSFIEYIADLMEKFDVCNLRVKIVGETRWGMLFLVGDQEHSRLILINPGDPHGVVYLLKDDNSAPNVLRRYLVSKAVTAGKLLDSVNSVKEFLEFERHVNDRLSDFNMYPRPFPSVSGFTDLHTWDPSGDPMQ